MLCESPTKLPTTVRRVWGDSLVCEGCPEDFFIDHSTDVQRESKEGKRDHDERSPYVLFMLSTWNKGCLAYSMLLR